MRGSIAVLMAAAFWFGACLPASGAKAAREWRDGRVLEIGLPGEHQPESQDPFVSANREQTPYPLASTGVASYQVYVIEADGVTYAATGDPPGRKSYLGGLKPGDRIRCAVERKTLYIRNPRGREYRLTIRAPSAASVGKK
jgi:hypothetical protein